MDDFQSQLDAFSQQVEEELREGALSFPTVFDLSLRIKKLADDPDSSLNDITAAVRAEPVLAAKVIRMANTLSMNPYRGEITGLPQAIGRIGLSTLRCLAFAVAAEQVARDHRSRQMRLIATGLWMHSVHVASWACAFAHHLGRRDADAAMLAGLVLDIGQFFLLARAARYPALESDMGRFAEAVAVWDDPVRGAILEDFGMPEVIIDACTSDPIAITAWPPVALNDVLHLATLAAETPNPFDSLLGIQNRPELRDASLGEVGASEFETLVAEARETRLELISAVSD